MAFALLLWGSTALLPHTTLAQTDAPGGVDAVSEVERLRGLLERYHSNTTIETEASQTLDTDVLSLDTSPSRKVFDEQLALPYSAEKIMLRSDELGTLIDQVQGRLADPAIEARRSETPMIGGIQSRDGGALVSNSTFSFAHLGKHHYVARESLTMGRNTLTVIDKQWRLDLAEEDGASEQLILLYAPPTAEWELHVLPASATEDYPGTLPPWLAAPDVELPGEATPTP